MEKDLAFRRFGARHISKSHGDGRTRLSNSVRQWERFFMGGQKDDDGRRKLGFLLKCDIQFMLHVQNSENAPCTSMQIHRTYPF